MAVRLKLRQPKKPESEAKKLKAGKNGMISKKSDKGPSERSVPAAFLERQSSRDHGHPSPDEMSGREPTVSPMSVTTRTIMMTTNDQYGDPNVMPSGFRNGKAPQRPAAICYRNAPITMLLNLPYFVNWLTGSYSSENSADSTGTVLDALRQLAREYWSQGSPKEGKGPPKKVISGKQKRLEAGMDAFWKHFVNTAPDFTPIPAKTNRYRQEDAAEFLLEMFNLAWEESCYVS